MNKTGGLLMVALVLLCLSRAARAETVTATVPLSPAQEVPPIVGLNATGTALITFTVNRDAGGAITGGAVNFLVNVKFSGSVTITGLHIHEGMIGAVGSVIFDAGLSATNSRLLADGVGTLNLNATNVDAQALQRLLQNPAGFYANLHTSVNAGGALRGQLTKVQETVARTVALSTTEEVPPISGLNASGTATITANPTRSTQGAINGGTVTFTVTYDFSGSVTITGLHIHEAPAGTNGNVVINTGISGSAPVISQSGKGTISIVAPLTGATVGALQRLLANPAGFYVNLHTMVNPGGAIRGQLAALAAPPVITTLSSYLLMTGSANNTLTLSGTGFDANSIVLINGQTMMTSLNAASGDLSVTISPALLMSDGPLFVQVRSGGGLLSTPLALNVVSQANLNATAARAGNAAGFTLGAAPDSIGLILGTRLASQAVSAPGSLPFPNSLDGTTVYVNGVIVPLSFVSATQINCLWPTGLPPGIARLVIVAKDGTVSQGELQVINVAPGIFTRTANGRGAPAAVASSDGVNFNLTMSNADGTPVEISAGTYVTLFGTGWRFHSGDVRLTVGNGMTIPFLYAGTQGDLLGLDQFNFRVPESLAGRGDLELVVTMDGRPSNPVRLKIK
jgi:uncharacterized protein (TIGR03437 family)